jgi:hypothetical protein
MLGDAVRPSLRSSMQGTDNHHPDRDWQLLVGQNAFLMMVARDAPAMETLDALPRPASALFALDRED